MKFNDLKAKLRYIQVWHHTAVAAEKKKERESNGKYTAILPDLNRAIKLCKRKHDKYYGNSKYTPHQGYQEQERRRNQ